MEFIRKNAFWIGFIGLSALYIFLILSQYTSYNSLIYKDQKFRLVSVDGTQVVLCDGDQLELVFNSAGDLPDKSNCEAIILYRDEVMRYKRCFANSEKIYTFSDGTQMTEPLYSVARNFSGAEAASSGVSNLQTEEKNLMDRLYDYYTNFKLARNYIATGFLAVILLLLGSWALFRPTEAWRVQTQLYVKNGEPTDYAIISNRIGGAIIIIFAFISLLFVI